MRRGAVPRLIVGGIIALASGCVPRPGGDAQPSASASARTAPPRAVAPVDPGSPDAAKPAQRVAIRAAQMVDVKAGALIKDAVVLIEGQRISAAGSNLPIPDGVKVMDLGAVTVMPGLIDCHTHLLMRLKKDEKYAQHLMTSSIAHRALEGAANARQALLAGFTTVRDVESEGSGYADVALRDAIREGLVEGPRMFVATRAIAAVGQYNPFGISPDLKDFPTGAEMVSGVEEARRAVREQIGHGADLIKVYADWDNPTLTPEELKVIVEEAHKQHHKVAAHATTTEGIRNAVTAGVDSVEHCDEPDRATLELMKKNGTFLVSTAAAIIAARDTIKQPEARAWLDKRIEVLRQTLALARQVGVKIAGGMDASEESLQGKNARQIMALVDLGMPPAEAIRTETVSAAELLDVSDRLGVIEPGKVADLIAVEGDPLTEIGALERVKLVMKAGAVVKDDRAAK